MIPPERTFSYEKTKQIAQQFFKKINYSVISETVCIKKDAYPTFVTYLKTNDKKFITRGNGKGIGAQSELSSVFEGIEHLFYESYFCQNILKWKGIKNKSLKKTLTKMESYYFDTPLYENMKTCPYKTALPSARFKNFLTNEKLYIPFSFCSPSYPRPALNFNEATFLNSVYFDNKKNLKSILFKNDTLKNYSNLESSLKYSSSVGSAAGIDFDETFLHALNEVIERDTTSEFLLRAIVKGDYSSYSVILKETLDKENLEIVRYLEKEYDIEIIIIDITAVIGIPTIMVMDKNNKYAKETLLTGYGTSLLVEYAIQRALLEYKQTIDLVLFDKTLPTDDNYYSFLKEKNVHEFFLKLYYFDYNEMIKKLQTKSLNELKTKYEINVYTITEMLDFILKRLKYFNFEILYKCDRFKVKEGTVYYLKVFIPQMCDITDPGPLRLPSKRKIIDIQKELEKNETQNI